MSCFRENTTDNSFVTETVFYVLLPFALVSLGGLSAWLFFSCASTPQTEPLSSGEVELTDFEAPLEIRVAASSSSVASDDVKGAALSIAVITLFLLQPTLVKKFALLFSCTRMGTGSQDIFLMEDLSVICYTSEHWLWITALGLPLLLLYVIGIPYGMFYLFTRPSNRNHIRTALHFECLLGEAAVAPPTERPQQLALARAAVHGLGKDTRDFMNNYAFLFLGYRDEMYLWEVAMMARKGILSLIGVALVSDPRGQVMMGLLVIFLATVAHARFLPFSTPRMNTFEFLSLFVSAMTFFLGVHHLLCNHV